MNKQLLENAETCYRVYIKLTEAVNANRDSIVFLYWPPMTLDKSLKRVAVGAYVADLSSNMENFPKELSIACFSSVVIAATRNRNDKDGFEKDYKEVIEFLLQSNKLPHFKKAIELLDRRLIDFLKKDDIKIVTL